MKREQLDVLFRLEKDGEVTAVFPELPGTSAYDFTVYSHVGQHSSGVMAWYVQTKPAKPEQYGPLLAELRRVYDDCELVIKRRMTRKHFEARAEACRGVGVA